MHHRRPTDRVIFESPRLRIGEFRAGVGHPRFTDSGPIDAAIFVFPRTSVVIRHEANTSFTTDTCTVTYYNPGQRYTREPADPRGDRCEWFQPRTDVLVDVLREYDRSVADRPERPFPFTHGPSDPTSYALQRQLVRYVRRAGGAADASVVEELAVDILRRLLGLRFCGGPSAPGRRSGSGAGPEALGRSLRRFLLAHFREPLSLEEIAATVGSSVSHACRVFRREHGITIHRYRTQLRLRRSLELMAEPARDLTDVALHLGYSSHSHFTWAFRKLFGITPSAFRRTPSSARIRALARRLARHAL